MQFENISIHCENGNIVESCEITAAVAPSPEWSSDAENSADTLCYILCILIDILFICALLLATL